jgi:hypothetical protein
MKKITKKTTVKKAQSGNVVINAEKKGSTPVMRRNTLTEEQIAYGRAKYDSVQQANKKKVVLKKKS